LNASFLRCGEGAESNCRHRGFQRRPERSPPSAVVHCRRSAPSCCPSSFAGIRAGSLPKSHLKSQRSGAVPSPNPLRNVRRPALPRLDRSCALTQARGNGLLLTSLQGSQGAGGVPLSTGDEEDVADKVEDRITPRSSAVERLLASRSETQGTGRAEVLSDCPAAFVAGPAQIGISDGEGVSVDVDLDIPLLITRR